MTPVDPGLVTEQDRQEAARLTSSATQAAIVGDHSQAKGLLLRAGRLDPQAANVAYLLARAHEELGERSDALLQYCRYLALAPNAPDAADVQVLIGELDPEQEPAYSDEVLRHFRLGVTQYGLRRFDAAQQAFSDVIRDAPEWPEAFYNRGLVYLEQESYELAAANLERYLALSPDAADRADVSRIVESIRNPTVRYSPTTAFTAGLLLPGVGHYYTGRPVVGTLLLGAVGGSVAFGLLSKDVTIECRTIPVDNVCPAGEIVSEQSTRPYAAPALGVAGVIALIGAIDAYRGAKRRNQVPDAFSQADTRGVRVGLPRLAFRGSRTRIEFLRLTF